MMYIYQLIADFNPRSSAALVRPSSMSSRHDHAMAQAPTAMQWLLRMTHQTHHGQVEMDLKAA